MAKTLTTGLTVVTVLSLLTGPALADSFDEQINAVKQQMAGDQANSNAAHAQANTAAAQLAQYNQQIRVVNEQIRLSQLQSDQLNAQIADAQAKMAAAKANLAASLKSMYLDSTVTPLEMLASSNNLSDYFNAQQYQDTIKSKIEDAMSTIQKLKTQLEDQQKQVNIVLANQKNQQAQLAALQQNAAALYAQAANNAAAADAQVSKENGQIASLKAQQAATIAAASRHISGGASGGAGCGGYPAVWCNSGQDTIIDSWGMYNRECVSYAAWAASARFGHNVPYWGGHGNANQWPGNARAAGIPVDGTPHVGDVAIYMGGTFGHAMIVEQIQGSSVIVSSFNADNTGHYSVDQWSTSSLLFIHFN